MDRRDARRLAQLYRAGQLVAVHFPTPREEARPFHIRSRSLEGVRASRADENPGYGFGRFGPCLIGIEDTPARPPSKRRVSSRAN
jgi:hypothetical protein